MAINENTDLKNRNALFLATSGMGKSATLEMRGGVPKSGARVVLWDSNKDHAAHRFDSLAQFMRALAAAHKSGKGFRIAYTGEASSEAFEIWAHGVWEILDGNRLTHAVVEEYSDCCSGPGGLSLRREKYHRRLWTQGRKYGLIMNATSQRPQLITKDALGNAFVIWASSMDVTAAKRIAQEMNINADELTACMVGQFWFRDKNIPVPAEKIQVFVPKS